MKAIQSNLTLPKFGFRIVPALVRAGLFFMSLERVATAEVFFFLLQIKSSFHEPASSAFSSLGWFQLVFVFFLIVANQKLVGMRVLMKY